MKFLEELENRVLQLIQKNKDLKGEAARFKQDNIRLVDQIKKLEAVAVKNDDSVKDLGKERDAIKSSIEELLSSMDMLEEISSENT